VRFLENGGLKSNGATWAVHRVGRRGELLTRRRAPQGGATPVYKAAQEGHWEVVQRLVQAGADKDAPEEVREGRGLDVGRRNGVCVSCWGLQHGRWLPAC